MTHTPGPWIIDRSYMHSLVVGLGRESDRAIPCPGSNGAMSWTDRICDMPRMGGEHEANAKLIAAAPTMYKYLARRAGSGDSEAIAILEQIDGPSKGNKTLER